MISSALHGVDFYNDLNNSDDVDLYNDLINSDDVYF